MLSPSDTDRRARGCCDIAVRPPIAVFAADSLIHPGCLSCPIPRQDPSGAAGLALHGDSPQLHDGCMHQAVPIRSLRALHLGVTICYNGVDVPQAVK